MYGVFVDDMERFHVVTEYAPRGSLSTALKEGFVGGDLDKVRIALGVARGVSYLHTREPSRIVHGALKPTNIVLAEDGRPMLVDFGLAETKASSEKNSVDIETDVCSQPYIAPELFLEPPRLGRKNDIYSFGMLLWVLFTGQTPFEDEHDILKALNAHHLRPEIPSSWSVGLPGLTELVRECWDAEPLKRPESTSVVARLTRLEKMLVSSPAFSSSPGHPK